MLILAAKVAHIVPVGIFTEIKHELPSSRLLVIANRGRHFGFVNRDGTSWMDDELVLS